MAIELRLPSITGVSEKEQLLQIKSYLYQIVPELQYALDTIGSSSGTSEGSGGVANQPYPGYTSSVGGGAEQVSFNAIKSLIIKSADIVNAYYEEINKRLESVYVAQSDFGQFKEQNSQTIEENSAATTRQFENTQAIITNQEGRMTELDADLQDTKTIINDGIQGVQDRVTGVNALLEDAKAQLKGIIEDLEVYVASVRDVIIGVTAYVKSGLLYQTDAGVPVYGVEIGQEVETDGEKVFHKFSRFTSEKLSFYDQNDIEVAYISDKKLYIKMAHITVSLQLGGLIQLVMASGDVVEKWVGIGG